MALRTRLTERLGIRHPVLLALHSVEPAGAIVARIVGEAEAALAQRFN
jgi:hypothetical protein